MTDTKIENKKVTGRIIKVSKEGWGFISSKEIEFTRIFFHWTALRQDTIGFKELKTGMMVEFVPVQVPENGWRAHHIRVIDKREKSEGPEWDKGTADLSHIQQDMKDLLK